MGIASGSLLLLAALSVSACTTAAGRGDTGGAVASARPSATAAAAIASAAPDAVTTATPSPPVRIVTEQAWTPFASVGGVTLLHPSARVERVAFHESNHDGAQQLEQLPRPSPR